MSIGPVLVVIAVLEIATPVCGLARNDIFVRFPVGEGLDPPFSCHALPIMSFRGGV